MKRIDLTDITQKRLLIDSLFIMLSTRQLFLDYPYLSFLEIKKARKFGLFNQIINDKILYLRR